MAFYSYGSDKERSRKRIVRNGGTVEERLYLGGMEVFTKLDANGVVVEEIETHHLYDGEQRLLLVEDVFKGGSTSLSDNTTLFKYQYSNHLGSVGLELDFEGKIISYEEYHPYGTTAFSAKNSDVRATKKRYRYTGLERDKESGLSYHSARYYLPWLGRWGSVDPAGSNSGLNIYRYARDNPLIFLDQNGKKEYCFIPGCGEPDVGGFVTDAVTGFAEGIYGEGKATKEQLESLNEQVFDAAVYAYKNPEKIPDFPKIIVEHMLSGMRDEAFEAMNDYQAYNTHMESGDIKSAMKIAGKYTVKAGIVIVSEGVSSTAFRVGRTARVPTKLSSPLKKSSKTPSQKLGVRVPKSSSGSVLKAEGKGKVRQAAGKKVLLGGEGMLAEAIKIREYFRQTVTLLGTKEGKIIISAQPKLSPLQIKNAELKGLIPAAELPGSTKYHAELKALAQAGTDNLTPTKGVVSTTLCRTGINNCLEQITKHVEGSDFSFVVSEDRYFYRFDKNPK